MACHPIRNAHGKGFNREIPLLNVERLCPEIHARVRSRPCSDEIARLASGCDAEAERRLEDDPYGKAAISLIREGAGGTFSADREGWVRHWAKLSAVRGLLRRWRQAAAMLADRVEVHGRTLGRLSSITQRLE